MGQGIDEHQENEFADLIQTVINETTAVQGKIQKNVYAAVRDRFHQSDLVCTISRRCNKDLVYNSFKEEVSSHLFPVKLLKVQNNCTGNKCDETSSFNYSSVDWLQVF